MVRRCKVGMQQVPEAFRTPSRSDEQGLRTEYHMIQLVKAICVPELRCETGARLCPYGTLR